MKIADSYDVAVIGAGPAGMSAAIELSALGIAVVVIDEQATPGGQIYRSITTTPVDKSIFGDDYLHGESIVRAFSHSGAHHAKATTVWAIAGDADRFELALSSNGSSRIVRARHVVVATGAIERPFPIDGWTLPGVMTAGAAQILLKASGIAPSGTTVLAGSGPLLYLIAAQLRVASVPIECILDTTPRGRVARSFRHAWGFVASPYFTKGRALLRDASRATTIHRGVDALAAEGNERLERIRYLVNGQTQVINADHLLLHQGVVPGINLTNAIGCAHHWNDDQLCFVPTVDAWGESSVEGITIAGDAAGIGGARAAAARGRLAALHTAHAIGRLTAAQRDRLATHARRELAHWMQGRRFVDAMYRPSPQFRIPGATTIVCRCEEVTAAQVVDAVRLGCVGPNQLKGFVRCGMGPCQGRMCGLTVTELIATERNTTPAATGYLRLRFPIKPVTLGELASMPQTEASIAAVVRIPQVPGRST